MSKQYTEPYAYFLLERFVPVSLFLNVELDVLYAHGDIDHYFRLPRALVRFNLNRMLAGEILILMSNAVNRCLEESRPVVYRNVTLAGPAESRVVDLQFQKVSISGRRQGPVVLLEIFPLDEPVRDRMDVHVTGQSMVLGEEVVGLERRLQKARLKRQRLLNEQEATNEELHTANRELMASNEELQSTNEELQSVNEELYTVNSELQMKNQALVMANDDMLNLLRSLDIATLFLDAQFQIRRFTLAIRRYIELLDSDIGRPISDFANDIMGVDIAKISRKVFQTLDKHEQEVRDSRGQSHLLRVLPYRTQDDQIQGLVITLVPVEEMVRTRKERAKIAARFKVIFEHSADAIIELDQSAQIRDLNRGVAAYGRSLLLGKSLYDLLAEPERTRLKKVIDALVKERQPAFTGMALRHPTSGTHRYSAQLVPLCMFQPDDSEGKNDSRIMLILRRSR